MYKHYHAGHRGKEEKIYVCVTHVEKRINKLLAVCNW